MSILERQVSSSSIFVSFFIVMTHNSSVNFRLIHFLLWAKGSHQNPNFDTLVKICQIPHVICQTTSQFFFKFFITMSGKMTPLYLFSSSNKYFAQKDPIKKKFLRLSSAQVKICQIPYVNFETTSLFLSKFCIPRQCHER